MVTTMAQLILMGRLHAEMFCISYAIKDILATDQVKSRVLTSVNGHQSHQRVKVCKVMYYHEPLNAIYDYKIRHLMQFKCHVDIV